MTENDGKNDTYEKFEPTETNLDYKPDTSVPNTEPEVKPEPGAKPGPEDEPRAEPPVRGTLPYSSSKQPIMETDYRFDKKTMKYRDMERDGDSDENYIPEPELEQTEPDEPGEEQDNGDTEKGEELEEDPIKVQLKNYERSENPMKNFEVAKE